MAISNAIRIQALFPILPQIVLCEIPLGNDQTVKLPITVEFTRIPPVGSAGTLVFAGD